MIRWALAAGLLLAVAVPAEAEFYIAAQAGGHFPQALRETEYSSNGVTLKGNDLSQSSSGVYGAKLGYYSKELPWIGLETELYHATPHIRQQPLIINGVNFGTAQGQHHRVLTWAPLNLVLRAQLGPLEPYIGGGIGVFFSHLDLVGASSDAVNVGLNANAGLRYRITQHVAMFGEWKYNYAELTHRDIGNTGLDIKSAYSANIVVFGIGIHF